MKGFLSNLIYSNLNLCKSFDLNWRFLLNIHTSGPFNIPNLISLGHKYFAVEHGKSCHEPKPRHIIIVYCQVMDNPRDQGYHQKPSDTGPDPDIMIQGVGDKAQQKEQPDQPQFKGYIVEK